MNRSQKLVLIIGVTIFASIVLVWFRTFVVHDYLAAIMVECDPSNEECFIDDSGEEPLYFKILETKISDLQTICGDRVESCTPSCDQIGGECSYTYCDTNTAERYGACSRDE